MNRYLLKLRIILLSKTPYVIFFLISIIITIIRLIIIPSNHFYQEKSINLEGKIIKLQINQDLLKLTIKNQGNLDGYYYFNTVEEKETFLANYELGDKIKITGQIVMPLKSTVPYVSINNQHTPYIKITSYLKISSNNSWFMHIQNLIRKRIRNIKTGNYIESFLLGDKSNLDMEVSQSYQINGISHLFALSGMHVTFLSSLCLWILSKFIKSEHKRYFITFLIIFSYFLLVNTTPSILRAVIFFFLFSLNRLYYLHISPLSLFVIALSIVLLYNPFFIYDIGFQFSFLISFFLLSFTTWLKDSNYIKTLGKVSILAFLSSMPIMLYHFSQINILSIVYNLFFVPFVSYIIYPMSFITFCLPFFDNIYYLFIQILEKLSLYLVPLSNKATLIFPKPSIFICLLLILGQWLFCYWWFTKEHHFLLLLLVGYSFYYMYPYIVNQELMIFIDVGQGDSILLLSKNKSMLIDTGGKLSYDYKEGNKKDNHDLTKYKTIPLLKAKGIRKLNYLVLTHGDQDHMGEADYLIKHFPVEQILLNEGSFNFLEKQLKEDAKKEKITIRNCHKNELWQVGNFTLQSINTNRGDENDSSIVLLGHIFNKYFLLMGDASSKTEQQLLDEYSLPKVAILKVGHHGSNTSSSKNFIKTIDPQISIISVGKNNRYNHPDDKVLVNLNTSKIYRTDLDGSIMFKFKKKQVTIKSFKPAIRE